MRFWEKLFRREASLGTSEEKRTKTVSAEWREEFANRREAFIESLRAAVAGSEVESRVYNAEDGYQPFSEWVGGELVKREQGTLTDAEGFLRHLIDQGHKVAYAVRREGGKSYVCVSYDCDAEEWGPTWPVDFHVDVSRTSEQMIETW